MEFTIRATCPNEIELLSRAVAMALSSTAIPAPSIAQTTESVVGENVEITPNTEKRGRGRPKKTTTEMSAVPATTDAATTDVVTDVGNVPSVEEFRTKVVRAADSSEGAKGQVADILRKYTVNGTTKTVDVPEDKRNAVLEEIANLAE